eukprot:CAMPEP_0178908606 /NCGR_PEP_ID=MMETSP0786-20121207/8015_1 /TAXON_ID=186022 /ORGANISM="Thalassionema frauenfeldii, Strain CCMP 1798" /LENGTH=38 /DNA_ID= /DNA_START= /DNA_END= /DNA_ORIENTATION=
MAKSQIPKIPIVPERRWSFSDYNIPIRATPMPPPDLPE